MAVTLCGCGENLQRAARRARAFTIIVSTSTGSTTLRLMMPSLPVTAVAAVPGAQEGLASNKSERDKALRTPNPRSNLWYRGAEF